MISHTPLDIFRVEGQGVLWMELAATLENASVRIQELALSWPGEFVVANHLTGNKYVFNTGQSAAGSGQ